MLDIKVLRQEPERIKEALKKRFNPLDIEPAIELDKQRRAILAEVEQKKAKQNEITKQIPQMKKNGENTDQIFAEMKELSNDIKADDEKVRDIDEQLRNFMLRIPNIPNPEVPVGKDDTENVNLESSLNRESLILNQRLTGISVQTLIFLILNAVQKLPVLVSQYIKVLVQDLKEPLFSSSLILTQKNRAILKSSHRIW